MYTYVLHKYTYMCIYGGKLQKCNCSHGPGLVDVDRWVDPIVVNTLVTQFTTVDTNTNTKFTTVGTVSTGNGESHIMI